MKHKKILKISFLAVAVLAVAALYVLCRDVDTQPDMKSDTLEQGAQSKLPFPVNRKNGTLEVGPGLVFKICTAATISSIDDATLDELRRRGCRVDSSATIVSGRTRMGRFVTAVKVYDVDLPLYAYKFDYDSTRTRHIYEASAEPVSCLRHVRFIKADDGEISAVGMDILSKFIVEYCYDSSSLSFHHSLPANYDSVGEIHHSADLSEIIGSGSRYFVDLTVDNKPHTFLISTSLNGVNMKMPIEDADGIRNEHRMIRCVRGIEGSDVTCDAVVDPDAWIGFGNRAGTRQVYYFSDNNARYMVNPLLFFRQDIAIDFLNERYYLRPVYERTSRRRM